MKHPASWESNWARRTYLVLAFPIIVIVIFLSSLVIELVDAVYTAGKEVKSAMGLTFTNIKEMWFRPLK